MASAAMSTVTANDSTTARSAAYAMGQGISMSPIGSSITMPLQSQPLPTATVGFNARDVALVFFGMTEGRLPDGDANADSG
jgi:hypothetical protein